MAESALFQPLWDGYGATFDAAVSDGVARGLAEAALWIQGAIGLYVLITGILIALGSMTFASGVKRMIRALLIIALLVPANYNRFVVQTFTVTVPQRIAASAGGAGPTAQGAQMFDDLVAADERLLAQTLANAGSNPFNTGKIISAYLASALAQVMVLAAFAIWFLAYHLASLVLILGPYVSLFWLFDATRSIPERFFGKMIGYMALMLLVLIVTQIVQTQERAYIRQYAALMTAGPTFGAPVPNSGFVSPDGAWIDTSELPSITSGGGGNLDEQVSLLWKVALAFGFGLFMLVFIPGIAAYIGGGVAFSIAPMLITAGRAFGGRVAR